MRSRRPPTPLAALVVAACVIGLAASGAGRAGDNPGYDRPGLGFTPAVLGAGEVTFEQGLPDFSRADGSTAYDADSLLRVGLGHALELQIGSGWSRTGGAGPTRSGRDDSSLALKFAPAADGAFSWGLLGAVSFSDGDDALGNQRKAYTAGASFNWQLASESALGLYLEAGHGDDDSQLVAANYGRNVAPQVAWYVELGADHSRLDGDGSVGGGGITWQVSPRVQLDLSARHRLGGHAATWEGGFGIGVYFGD